MLAHEHARDCYAVWCTARSVTGAWRVVVNRPFYLADSPPHLAMHTMELNHSVHDLMHDHIHSHEKLRALLLLREQTGPMTLQRVARELDLPTRDVQVALSELCSSGLIALGESVHEFVYSPVDDAKREAVNRLARAFDEQPVVVLKSLSQIALDRVRHQGARAFSNAFLWRRKKKRLDS